MKTLSAQPLVILSLLSLLVLLPACGGSGGGPTEVVPAQGLRFLGPRTAGGDGEALAAAVLLTAAQPAARPGRLAFRLADGRLEKELLRLAQRHVITQVFGGTGGASLAGSARIRRLAAASTLPDRNQNGTNLDEMLAEDLADLANLAGTEVDSRLRPIMFPWQTGDARFAARIDARSSSRGQATLKPTNQHVDTAQVGRAMRARLLMASGLLQQNRGSRPGATPEDGMLGLTLLQQVVAAEETLLAAVFFDGRALASLDAPKAYDPSDDRFRWLPSRFRVIGDAKNPQIPAAYGLVDGASSLWGLAEMLHAMVEVAFLASAQNPNPNLRDLFHGRPFGNLPASDPGRPTKPLAAVAVEVTWDKQIKPLVAFRCAGCHGGPAPIRGLSFETFNSTLRGGNNSGAGSQTPIIVKGDHSKSLMWQVLIGSTAVTSVRMPKGGFALPQGEQDLIADWIDQGALESPRQPPEPGVLALVLVRNLRAMHMNGDGALHHRHEGDAPSGWVSSAATGRALKALSAAVQVLTTETQAKDTLQKTAGFALQKLTDAKGRVVHGYDLLTKTAEGRADLLGQASMTAGLLAAARTLDDAAVEKRGLLLADVLAKEYLEGGGLFRTDLRIQGKH